MNDGKSSKPAGGAEPPRETIEQRQERLMAEVLRSRQAFDSHVEKFVEALRTEAFAAGWNNGFDRGWKAATEFLQKQTVEKRNVAAHAQAHTQLGDYMLPRVTRPSLMGSVGSSTNDLVYEFVRANPGKRGVEIANYFGANSPAVPERTVRTALHRLKMAERIRIVDGRWYAPEAAPADPQPQLLGDDDAAP